MIVAIIKVYLITARKGGKEKGKRYPLESYKSTIPAKTLPLTLMLINPITVTVNPSLKGEGAKKKGPLLRPTDLLTMTKKINDSQKGNIRPPPSCLYARGGICGKMVVER